MGDDRFCYLHAADELSAYAIGSDDDKLGWELPDDDIDVPGHLLPPYQDEEHDNVLPSATHPSYPYGNPYTRLPPLSGTSTSSAAHHARLGPPSLLPNASSGPSLATTLPALQLRSLYALTSFGNLQERTWNELGLDGLMKDRGSQVEESELAGGTRKVDGEGGPGPTGQNAGMEVETEDEGVHTEGDGAEGEP